MLHALEACAQAVAAEIEDELTDSEAGIGGNVLDHLPGGAGERPAFQSSLTLGAQRYIVQRGFVGDGERFRITSGGFGQALEITQRDLELLWAQWHSRVSAHRMPTVAITGGASQGRTAMATDPDGRMRFLHRVRQTVQCFEL